MKKFNSLQSLIRTISKILILTLVLCFTFNYEIGYAQVKNSPTPKAPPSTPKPPDPFDEPIKYYPEIFTRSVENFEQSVVSFCNTLSYVSYENVSGDAVSVEQNSEICHQLEDLQTYNEALDLQIEYLLEHPATKKENVEEILSLHELYANTFNELATLIENLLASTPDVQTLANEIIEPQFLNQLISLLEDSSAQKQAIQAQMDTIQLDLDRELERTLEQSKATVQNGILFGILALISLTVLSAWAFIQAGQVTRPILNLTNAVVALRGDQFRPELLVDVSRRKDSLGRVAREFEELAEEIKTKETQMKSEVHALREQLTNTRRQKLRTNPSIHNPNHDDEKN